MKKVILLLIVAICINADEPTRWLMPTEVARQLIAECSIKVSPVSTIEQVKCTTRVSIREYKKLSGDYSREIALLEKQLLQLN